MVIVSTNRLIRFTGVTPGKPSVNLQVPRFGLEADLQDPNQGIIQYNAEGKFKPLSSFITLYYQL
jgi:hypothetical protein